MNVIVIPIEILASRSKRNQAILRLTSLLSRLEADKTSSKQRSSDE